MPAMGMTQSPGALADQGDVTASCPRKSRVGEESLWPIEQIKGLGTLLPSSRGRSSRHPPFCRMKMFPVGGHRASWVASPALESGPLPGSSSPPWVR